MRLKLPVSGLAAALLAVSASLPAQGIDGDRLFLRYATFDPAIGEPAVPADLQGGVDTRLWIVQFAGAPTEAGRAALSAVGAQVHWYLPEHAYVVRMADVARRAVSRLPGIRATRYYHPAYRLEPELLQMLQRPESNEPVRYNVVLVDKHNDRPALIAKLTGIGGTIDQEGTGSILLEASLTPAQLRQAVRFDEVLWIDRWTPPELDMDNARIQGGANHVETQTQNGYSGKGINGHVYEGLEVGHKHFNNRPINVRSNGSVQSHGHCTAGIIFGNGLNDARGRGMVPDAQPHYTTYGSSVQGSRWQVVEDLVKNYKVMFTTASWGGGRTTQYTSTSASTDDIIFDHNIIWTNSQSNAKTQASRPEAWAKNIFSCGGFAHRDNSNPGDDSWRAGGASIGPAADGRLKPDLSAYYERIYCSDRTGSAGYNRSGDYYNNFGGTSGATPIIAGHNGVAIQMFTDGLFSPQRVKNGTRWQNMPHFTTLKALQIANASQYTFTKTSTDNRREHVGWGMPNLKTMYDRRNVHFVVDETDILEQGKGYEYQIRVGANEPELKISLCFSDPAGSPSASRTRINDLTLRVTAPDDTKYWGNVGLRDGNYSVPGGTRDTIDTVENVFIKSPKAGIWTIQVGAFLVVKDSHVETTKTDADFGLVSVGGTFVAKKTIELNTGNFSTFGAGCPSATACGVCFGRNWTQQSANKTTNATRIAILDYPAEKTAFCGVDLYAKARSGSVKVNVSLYDFNTSNAQPGKMLATGSVTIGSTLQSYGVDFTNKPVIGQGAIYFLVFDNADKLVLPAAPSGTLYSHYAWNGSNWGQFQADTNWQFRVRCEQGNQVPVMSATTRPLIGSTMDFELSNARGGTPALMLLGASDSSWGSLKLPFNYAANCNILVAGDIIVPFVTDSAGDGKVGIPLPNTKALIGVVTFQQFFVVDQGNKIGVIGSNGSRIKIGEF